MSEETTYLNLVGSLINAERAYYQKGEPTMTDEAYDALYRRVLSIEKSGKISISPLSPTQRVGPILQGDFQPVQHKRRMLSLENCYDTESLEKFVRNINEALPQGEDFDLILEPKIDGLALSLIYQNGKLISAATRGDGSTGENVLGNARTIKSIPLALGGLPPGTVEVRGEVYMPVTAFEELNKELEKEGKPLMSNPRNSATGALKSKDPAKCAKRRLGFIAYELIGHGDTFVNRIETQAGILVVLLRLGFNVPDYQICHRGIKITEAVAGFDSYRKGLDYWTDGTVLKLNDLKQRETVGEGTKVPKWATAAKFGQKSSLTKLKSITVQVGKTGALAPVAELEPIEIQGTIVKRASLHNYDLIKTLGISIGDSVEVAKAGEIIPQIIAKAEVQDDDSREGIVEPTTCPECGSAVQRDKSTIFCPNVSGCPAQLSGRLEHWCTDKALAIDGGGPVMIEALVKARCKSPADIYLVDENSFAQSNLGQRVIAKFLDAVQASKGAGLERVLYGLAIPYVGEGTAKRLATHFKSIEPLENATVEELMAIEDIGQQTAFAIHAWFEDEFNKDVIYKLKDLGVKMTSALAEQQIGDSLEGKTVVVSGKFECGERDYVKSMIEKHGGKATGSVSKKTSILVVGAEPGASKIEKANKFGVKIMQEDEFLKLINGASEN